MIFQTAIADRAVCTIEEKKECQPLLHDIISYSRKARAEGLLSIEKEIVHHDFPFFSYLMQFVVDGCDPDDIENIAINTILFSGITGVELLKHCIAVEGALSILSGDTPRICQAKGMAILGLMDTRDNGIIESYEESRERRFNEYLDGLEGKAALSEETTILDVLFDKLDDTAIQKILREVDADDLGKAMLGSSGRVEKLFMQNLSTRAGVILKEEMDYLAGISEYDIVASQKKILTIYERLNGSGGHL